MLPWWRTGIEWNMYISGLLLVALGLHINFCQHLYADAEAGWSVMEIAGNPRKHSESFEDDSDRYCGPCHKQFRFVAGVFPPFHVLAAIMLGFVQGLISPDFAFARGSAWAGEAFIAAGLLYAAFSVAIVFCAGVVTFAAWMMTSAEPRSTRGHRSARRSIGVALCCTGFLWLFLVLQLDIQISAAGRHASAAGSSTQPLQSLRRADSAGVQCPLPVSFGNVSFGSAPTWEMVAKLDPWWTEELIQQYRRRSFQYSVANSKIGGCGVFADEDLPVGARVGLAGILNGPWDYSAALVHVTPWLGIALNHCTHGNAELHREGALLMLVTKTAVLKGQEISFDYNSASDSVPIERAQPEWTC